MKTKLAALSTLLFPMIVMAQVDSAYRSKTEVLDTADSDPGLFMFMMFFLMLFVVVILFTAILTLIIAMFVVLLVLQVYYLLQFLQDYTTGLLQKEPPPLYE